MCTKMRHVRTHNFTVILHPFLGNLTNNIAIASTHLSQSFLPLTFFFLSNVRCSKKQIYTYTCARTTGSSKGGGGLGFKPRPFKHLFSTSNFTSTLLNCFVLEHSDFKTKPLRSVVVKCFNGLGFNMGITQTFFGNKMQQQSQI